MTFSCQFDSDSSNSESETSDPTPAVYKSVNLKKSSRYVTFYTKITRKKERGYLKPLNIFNSNVNKLWFAHFLHKFPLPTRKRGYHTPIIYCLYIYIYIYISNNTSSSAIWILLKLHSVTKNSIVYKNYVFGHPPWHSLWQILQAKWYKWWNGWRSGPVFIKLPKVPF